MGRDVVLESLEKYVFAELNSAQLRELRERVPKRPIYVGDYKEVLSEYFRTSAEGKKLLIDAFIKDRLDRGVGALFPAIAQGDNGTLLVRFESLSAHVPRVSGLYVVQDGEVKDCLVWNEEKGDYERVSFDREFAEYYVGAMMRLQEELDKKLEENEQDMEVEL